MLHLRRQRPDAILIAAHWDEVLCFQLQDKHPSSSGYSTKRVVPKWGSAADSFCHRDRHCDLQGVATTRYLKKMEDRQDELPALVDLNPVGLTLARRWNDERIRDGCRAGSSGTRKKQRAASVCSLPRLAYTLP